MASERSGLYTIGETVAALQRAFPDVTHSSLRFLEREGLVQPVRTPTGRRHYRASDIARVRRIKEWQAERLSLAEIRQRLERLASLPAPKHLARRFLDLALMGHGASALHEVLMADAVGMPIEMIYEDVFQPVLVEVGDRWHGGELGVAYEHEISELVRDGITELTMRHTQVERGAASAIAACVEGEQHDIGLRMVTSLLRSQGVDVQFLGANVSPRFLVDMVRRRHPAVVLLSVSLVSHGDALQASVEALETLRADIPAFHLFVGGQGLPVGEKTLPSTDTTVVADEGLGRLSREIAQAVARQAVGTRTGTSIASPSVIRGNHPG